jgi:hypothetical protein
MKDLGGPTDASGSGPDNAPCDQWRRDPRLHRRWDPRLDQITTLTGWSIDEIRGKMPRPVSEPPDDRPWWQRLWKNWGNRV